MYWEEKWRELTEGLTAIKMVQLSCKPVHLSSVPRTHMVEGENSLLSFDFHMDAMECVYHIHRHSHTACFEILFLNIHKHIHIHTYTGFRHRTENYGKYYQFAPRSYLILLTSKKGNKKELLVYSLSFLSQFKIDKACHPWSTYLVRRHSTFLAAWPILSNGAGFFALWQATFSLGFHL